MAHYILQKSPFMVYKNMLPETVQIERLIFKCLCHCNDLHAAHCSVITEVFPLAFQCTGTLTSANQILAIPIPTTMPFRNSFKTATGSVSFIWDSEQPHILSYCYLFHTQSISIIQTSRYGFLNSIKYCCEDFILWSVSLVIALSV